MGIVRTVCVVAAGVATGHAAYEAAVGAGSPSATRGTACHAAAADAAAAAAVRALPPPLTAPAQQPT